MCPSGSVPAPKVAAGLAGLTSRSSDRLSPEEAAFRDYGGMLLSVAYCETVLRDWTEAMHYIELHYYTVHATSPPDRSSNGGDVDGGGAAAAAGAQSAQTGDHDSDHSSPRSHHADASVAAADSTKQNEHSMDGTKTQSGSTSTRRRLAPWVTSADLHADPHFVNERLAGGVFDAVLSSLESLRTHFVDELVSALVYVFIRRTEPYRKKGHMWAVDVAPAGGSPTPSTTGMVVISYHRKYLVWGHSFQVSCLKQLGTPPLSLLWMPRMSRCPRSWQTRCQACTRTWCCSGDTLVPVCITYSKMLHCFCGGS